MFKVVKLNRVLYVQDADTNKLVYSPPEFIRKRIKNKEDLESLAQDLNAGVSQADAVTAFETKMAPG